MGTLFDYIKWRGDIPFSQVPVNEVDSLIFSLLSYLDLKGIVPEEHTGTSVPIKAAANTFFSRNPDYKKVPMGLILPREIVLLFREVKDCKRFRNVEMRAHVNKIDTKLEMQFSATTFLTDDGATLAVFRGTDDTIIGWKEDLNMSILPVVPAQKAALQYLEAAAQNSSGPLYSMGHSKGGNLAVYAAVMAEEAVQSRLSTVWNFDGPGFQEEFFTKTNYVKIRPLIRTVVPKDTFISLLLVHEENYTVVKSKQSGIWQHNGLNWEVLGPSFIRLPDIAPEGHRTDKNVNEWIRSMTPKQREDFIESIYSILTANNSLTLTDISTAWMRWLSKSKDLDPKVRNTVQEVFSNLINLNAKNLLSDFFPRK